MNDFYEDFYNYVTQEAIRVNKRFPSFWGTYIVETPIFHNMRTLFNGMHYDISALERYYRSKTAYKDNKSVFINVVKEIVDLYGYGPEQCNALAVWYFILVKMNEYDSRIGIDEMTDLSGLIECYFNTGEIDYEHSWST